MGNRALLEQNLEWKPGREDEEENPWSAMPWVHYVARQIPMSCLVLKLKTGTKINTYNMICKKSFSFYPGASTL